MNTQRKIVVEGPVFPIVTPFKDDKAGKFPVDYDALTKYTRYLIDNGAKNIMVASATSRFAQLTLQEMVEVNKVVFEAVGDDGLAIASTPILGPTAEHVDVSQKAEALGYPIIACEYPWRFQSNAALVQYFRTISEECSNIQIMLHVTPGRSELGGMYRYDVEGLTEVITVPRVIGMKEAAGDPDLSLEMWKALGDKTDIIVAGRASETYMRAYKHGATGFFVGNGNVVPQKSIEVFELVKEGKIEEAEKIVEQHEKRFLDLAKPYGWHAALKSLLADRGLMEITERPPMVPISESQRSELRALVEELGWS